jgi:hypothetical protein
MLRATVACLVVLACRANLAATEGEDVVVRLYAAGTVGADVRAAAIGVASVALRDSGVPLVWRDCTGGPKAGGCDGSRRPGDLIVRLTTSPVDGPQLGFAAVNADTGSGSLATVYVDRVDAAARRTHTAAALLLGRVIAHEVGHLVPALRGHAAAGLMRAVWTDRELIAHRDSDWTFVPAPQPKTVAPVAGAASGGTSLRADDAEPGDELLR